MGISNILLHFEIRARQTRLWSKTEANLWTFLPSVKFRGLTK